MFAKLRQDWARRRAARRAAEEEQARIGAAAAAEAVATARRLALPCCVLTPDPDGPRGPRDSRLFGPAWRPDGAGWPQGPNGPLDFVGQIDCGALKGLPQHPDHGLMQVFVDMSGALDGETGEPGCRPILHVDWHPQPEGDRAEPGPGRLHPVLIKGSPEAGLPLRAAPAVPMPATLDDPRVFEGFEARFSDGALEDAEAAVCDLWPEEGHHVGGHPLSAQGAGVFATSADGTAVARDDPRMEDPARQGLTIHDRVLLHVGFDDHVSWGDAGQLNVLIPEADLISRNFPAARAWFDGA